MHVTVISPQPQVSKLSADRVSTLEQALPLSEHFFETHDELSTWLDEAEAEALRLDVPALKPEQIIRQQDKTKALLNSVVDRKPSIDKLNKTGTALVKLVSEPESHKVGYHRSSVVYVIGHGDFTLVYRCIFPANEFIYFII